jgi:preprotein translocase subunit SecD
MQVLVVSEGSKSFVELRVRADFASLERDAGKSLTGNEKAEILALTSEILLARASALASGFPSVEVLAPDQIRLMVPGATIEMVRLIVETRGDLSLQQVDMVGMSAIKNYEANGGRVISDNGEFVNPASIADFPKESFIHGVYKIDDNGIKILEGVTVVTGPIVVDSNSVKSASIGRDKTSGNPVVSFLLNKKGGDALMSFTSTHSGSLINALIDGEAYAFAKVQQPIRDRVSISGFGELEALFLFAVMKAKPLPVRLKIVLNAS